MEIKKGRGRPKGLPRTGGRKPGTSNKLTKDLRSTISSFLQQNASRMQEEYEKLDPKDKLAFFEKMIKYSLPAMSAVDITSQGESISAREKALNNMTDSELEHKLRELKEKMN